MGRAARGVPAAEPGPLRRRRRSRGRRGQRQARRTDTDHGSARHGRGDGRMPDADRCGALRHVRRACTGRADGSDRVVGDAAGPAGGDRYRRDRRVRLGRSRPGRGHVPGTRRGGRRPAPDGHGQHRLQAVQQARSQRRGHRCPRHAGCGERGDPLRAGQGVAAGAAGPGCAGRARGTHGPPADSGTLGREGDRHPRCGGSGGAGRHVRPGVRRRPPGAAGGVRPACPADRCWRLDPIDRRSSRRGAAGGDPAVRRTGPDGAHPCAQRERRPRRTRTHGARRGLVHRVLRGWRKRTNEPTLDI